MKVMEAFAKIFGRRDKNKNPLEKNRKLPYPFVC